MVCDCGTSTCRASIVDAETGRSLVARSRSLPDGVFDGPEVDVELLWQAVSETLSETAGAHEGVVDVLTVSSFFGYAYLDGRTEPLGRATSWMDGRAEEEARTLAERVSGEPAARRTGRRLTGELLLPKLIRMAQQEPERFARLRTVVGIKDELVRRLTGEVGTDFAHADYTGGFDPAARSTIEEMWEAAGVSPDLLPRPLPATESAGLLTREGARRSGLREGTPVARGTSDGSAAMYGCGVMIPGVGAFVSGTTDVLMTNVPAGTVLLPAEDRSLTVNSSMIGDGTLVGGAMGFSGGAAAWVAKATRSSIDALEREAAAIAAGSDGLLMVPSLTGERSPFWNPAMHGAWIGIRASHSTGHLFRSCLEGSAVRAAILIERLADAGLVLSSLRIGGGGARSALWNRIRADASGLPLRVSEDVEATVRGAALLCLPLLEGRRMDESELAQRCERWLEPARSIEPDPSAREAYRRARRLYERALAFLPEG